MARQQIRRYIWLIDTIRSAGNRGITYEEINKKWMRSTLNDDGKALPLRTFHDQRTAILEEFDIEIECDRRDNTYRLAEEYNEYGSVKKTLIDSLVLNNAVRESPDLNDSIVFNDNFHQQCMPELIRAIKDRQTIRFRYKRQDRIPKFEPMNYDVVVSFQPYGLYNSTLWFTVGKNLKDGGIHIYALHRLSEIEFLDEHFVVPEDFNVKQYMSDFWVDDDDLGPEREPDDAFALESFEAGKDVDLRL